MTRRLLALVFVLGLGAAGLTALRSQPAVRADASNRHVSIMAYFRPGEDWQRLSSAPGVAYAVMNPANGPGDAPDADYARAVAEAQAHGVSVLGYVHTGYASRSRQDVDEAIFRYFTWYQVDGIFFDEASSSCGDEPYYQSLYSDVKSVSQNAIVVLDPGSVSEESECLLKAADALVTFEGSYMTYLQSFHAVSWTGRYPESRFWHLVYGASTQATMRYAVALSHLRHAGTIYITPDGLPNPWSDLPADEYLAGETGVDQCVTATPSDGNPAGLTVRLCSPSTAAVNQTVAFQAAAFDSQGQAVSGATYTWTFDDGQTARGAQVQHSFSSAALARVQVTVVTPDQPGVSVTAENWIAVLPAGAASQ